MSTTLTPEQMIAALEARIAALEKERGEGAAWAGAHTAKPQ